MYRWDPISELCARSGAPVATQAGRRNPSGAGAPRSPTVSCFSFAELQHVGERTKRDGGRDHVASDAEVFQVYRVVAYAATYGLQAVPRCALATAFGRSESSKMDSE
jgi:hypothetical protein